MFDMYDEILDFDGLLVLLVFQQTSKELLGCKKKLEASEGALVSLRSEMEVRASGLVQA